MSLDVAARRESFELVITRSPGVTARFYEILFARYPTVRSLFGRNTAAKQEEMLSRALGAVIDRLEDAPRLAETLGAATCDAAA